MELSSRKRIRLQGYDYSRPGYYFVTFCVKERLPLLCRGAHCAPASKSIPLSDIGEIVDDSIRQISSHYCNTNVDKYVIMPNHVHMILVLTEVRGRIISAPTKAIPTIVGQMKRTVSKKVGFPIWQKSYHDHIIRSQDEYDHIWHYIDTNPINWKDDLYYDPI